MSGRRKARGVAILERGRWLVILIVGLTAVIPATSAASDSPKLGCYAPFALPGGRATDNAYNAVTARSRKNMSCSSALRIGANAYSLPGLKPVYGPQFGGGGFGGPFHVGRFHCYLHSRGSDFKIATCQLGWA